MTMIMVGDEDDDNDDDGVDNGRGVRPSEKLRLFSDTVNHVLFNARDNVLIACDHSYIGT